MSAYHDLHDQESDHTPNLRHDPYTPCHVDHIFAPRRTVMGDACLQITAPGGLSRRTNLQSLEFRGRKER